jgi:hypothetical protein
MWCKTFVPFMEDKHSKNVGRHSKVQLLARNDQGFNLFKKEKNLESTIHKLQNEITTNPKMITCYWCGTI